MNLPRESENKIIESIKGRSKEKIEHLRLLESYIKNVRGYIFKMPKENTPVVVELSGGADSVVTTAMLIEEFGLRIYPIFINRGQRSLNKERESLMFFTNFYKRKYPNKFYAPIELNVPVPATEIKSDLTEKLRKNIGHPMRNSILTEYAVQYAYSLENKGLHVRTIFSSVVSSDANYLYHSTITALRSQMLHTMIDMGDMTWQVTSLPIEKELGFYFDKPTLVKWAIEHGIPVERTRTCVEQSDIQCGRCVMCYNRKRSFEEAGVKDKTEYLDTSPASLVKPKEDV